MARDTISNEKLKFRVEWYEDIYFRMLFPPIDGIEHLDLFYNGKNTCDKQCNCKKVYNKLSKTDEFKTFIAKVNIKRI